MPNRDEHRQTPLFTVKCVLADGHVFDVAHARAIMGVKFITEAWRTLFGDHAAAMGVSVKITKQAYYRGEWITVWSKDLKGATA